MLLASVGFRPGDTKSWKSCRAMPYTVIKERKNEKYLSTTTSSKCRSKRRIVGTTSSRFDLYASCCSTLFDSLSFRAKDISCSMVWHHFDSYRRVPVQLLIGDFERKESISVAVDVVDRA